MLRKITIDELREGMYVEQIDKGWLELPFFRKRITNKTQIDKLRRYHVKELHIDTGRGKDITDYATHREAKLTFPSEDGQATTAVMEPLTSVETLRPVPPPVDPSIAPRPYQEEIGPAKVAYSQAIDTMRDILEETRSGKALHEEGTRVVVSELVNSCMRNDDALVSLSKLLMHDEYTFSHSVNVTVFSLALGKSLGMAREELQPFGESVLLHDVGKMLVPPDILNKPGKLTPEEFEIMKLHVDRGVDVLQSTFPHRPELAVVAAEHHERFDGSGYPRGLRGGEISRWGQVSAVADVYDALTSERCYKSAMPTVKAVSLIYRLRGGDFNPHFVDKFVECVGIYPIGTLVRLNTREIGIVTSIRHEDLLRPCVRVLFRGNSRLRRPSEVNLAELDDTGEHIRRVDDILNPEDFGIDPAVHVLEA